MLRRLFLGLALLALPAAADAGSLNLVQAFPDITAAAPAVNYVAATEVFTATDTALSYRQTIMSPPQIISGASYSLTASIDSAEALSGGTLSIDGTLGPDSGSLLTGNLTAFGFTQNYDSNLFLLNTTFEFLFTVTGGALAGDFGGVGAQGGIILSASDFALSPISFSQDFGFDPLAGAATDADTFGVVPEPASMVSLAAGLVGIGVIARRRATRKPARA